MDRKSRSGRPRVRNAANTREYRGREGDMRVISRHDERERSERVVWKEEPQDEGEMQTRKRCK